jgi:hypothetical protein
VEKARKRPAGGRTWGRKRGSSANGLGEKERLTAWRRRKRIDQGYWRSFYTFR